MNTSKTPITDALVAARVGSYDMDEVCRGFERDRAALIAALGEALNWVDRSVPDVHARLSATLARIGQ